MRLTGVLLLAANLVPVYGVLVWDWQVFPIILLYWLENLAMGALQIIKLVFASPGPDVTGFRVHAGKLFLIPFFTVHYGLFCLVHGVFVFSIFADKSSLFGGSFVPTPTGVEHAVDVYHLGPALLALVASHSISTLIHFFGRGERHVGPEGGMRLMMSIYPRIIVLHITILIGGFVSVALGSPAPALLLLIVLKSAIDWRAHRREHSVRPSAFGAAETASGTG